VDNSASHLIPTPVNTVQAGDQIVMGSEVWTVKGLDGPDRIGTYDLFLLNNEGTSKVAFANGFVTLVR
jgi:hypothetical protein